MITQQYGDNNTSPGVAHLNVGRDNMKRSTVIVVILVSPLLAAAILLSLSLLERLEGMKTGPAYAQKQERMVRRVMAADPDDLLSAGRQLLQSHPGFVGYIRPRGLGVPSAIRRLKPRLICFVTNAVYVDFSDVFNPFGITVYAVGFGPPTNLPYGLPPRQWIEGLWVFDDGQLEWYGRDLVPADRSQPIRAVTNSTPPAAGSRR